MAVESKVGTFTIASTDAVSTTQEITIGFEPKVIFFWTTGNPSTTDNIVNANARYGFGVASSTTSRRAVGGRSTDGSIAINGGRIMRNDACLALCLNTSGIDGLLDISAISSTSFTTIVDDQFTADIRVSYMAVGGSDITNVDIGDITAATSTGNQSITGLGFQPDFVLNFGTASTTAPNNTSASRDFLSVGAAVSATDQAIISMGEGPEGNATSLAKSYLYYGEVSAPLFDTPTSIANRASFVSFDSDGWTVNWLEAAYAYRLFYVAIKGGSWKVGNLSTQTDTSTAIAVSGLGFTPVGVMLFSHMTTQSAQDTVQSHGAISIGAFTGTSERVAQALFLEDGLADTRVSSAIEHDAVYININSAATSTVQGLADVVSMDSNGFTLIMDDADPTPSFAWFFAVGGVGGASYENSLTLASSADAASSGKLSANAGLTLAAGVAAVDGGALNGNNQVPLAVTSGIANSGRLSAVLNAALASSVAVSDSGLLSALGSSVAQLTVTTGAQSILSALGRSNLNVTLAIAELGKATFGVTVGLATTESMTANSLFSSLSAIVVGAIAAVTESGSGIFAANASVTVTVEVAAGTALPISATVTVGVMAGQSSAASLVLMDSALLAMVASLASAGQLIYRANVAVAATSATQANGQLAAAASTTMGFTVSFASGTTAPISVTLALPMAAGLAPATVAQMVASATMAIVASMAEQSSVVMGGSVLAGVTVSVSDSAANTQSMTLTLPVVPASVANSQTNSQATVAIANMVANMVTGQVAGLNHVALAHLQSIVAGAALSVLRSLALQVASGLLANGSVIAFSITTPDGRTVTVKFESRIIDVAIENRVVGVDGENRVVVVDGESRVVIVDLEDRTIRAK